MNANLTYVQERLNEIRALAIYELYEEGTSKAEKLAKLKLIKQKFNLTKGRLREGKQTVKQSIDGRRYKSLQHETLIPFTLADNLVKAIDIYFKEIENNIQFNHPLPPQMAIPTIIASTPNDIRIFTLEQMEAEMAAVKEELHLRTKAAFEKAKGLVALKQYKQALALIKPLDHPAAREWEQKLAPLVAKQEKAERRRKQRTFIIVVVFGVIATIAILAMANSTSNAPKSSSLNLNPQNNQTATPTFKYVTAPADYAKPPPTIYRSPTDIPYSGGGGSTCADGTHSSSTGRGTCSHHGGVAH